MIRKHGCREKPRQGIQVPRRARLRLGVASRLALVSTVAVLAFFLFVFVWFGPVSVR